MLVTRGLGRKGAGGANLVVGGLAIRVRIPAPPIEYFGFIEFAVASPSLLANCYQPGIAALAATRALEFKHGVPSIDTRYKTPSMSLNVWLPGVLIKLVEDK